MLEVESSTNTIWESSKLKFLARPFLMVRHHQSLGLVIANDQWNERVSNSKITWSSKFDAKKTFDTDRCAIVQTVYTFIIYTFSNNLNVCGKL